MKKQTDRVGESHFDTASARGTLAIGLMRAGRDLEAVREFKAAIPGMMAAAQENADDDKVTLVAARTQRLQGIVENYFILQARNSEATGEIGEETFSLADLRGPKVTLRLQLRFEAFGSTRIDLESVKMTYLRTPTSI